MKNITINNVPGPVIAAIAKSGQRRSGYARKALAAQLAKDGHKEAAKSLSPTKKIK
jgi:hypothetical protein